MTEYTYNDMVGEGMKRAVAAIDEVFDNAVTINADGSEPIDGGDFGSDVIRALAEDIAPTYNVLREVPVELPYTEMSAAGIEDAREVLVIDPVTVAPQDWDESLEQLAHAQSFTEDEVARVITGAALLLANRAGDLSQCLHTALIWERG